MRLQNRRHNEGIRLIFSIINQYHKVFLLITFFDWLDFNLFFTLYDCSFTLPAFHFSGSKQKNLLLHENIKRQSSYLKNVKSIKFCPFSFYLLYLNRLKRKCQSEYYLFSRKKKYKNSIFFNQTTSMKMRI